TGKSGHKTVGVLMDYMAQFMGSYQSHFRSACHAIGRRYDVNVVLVYGGAIACPGGLPVAQNAIFDLVHGDYFDGLIFLSSTLSLPCGPSILSEFVQRYASIPRCSVGLQLPGIPSVVTDNCHSMRTIVEHMILMHGCRRIACINGPQVNPEAQQRFTGYREALERHGIRFDTTLVTEGDFLTSGGRQAIRELFARNTTFDAVVAANDAMALAAIQELRRQGVRVPRDVPVTGYDNLQLASLENPPLTTVAQPFIAMAERAFQLLFDQIDGRKVEELTELVGSFVLRRSCGCGHHIAVTPDGNAPHSTVNPIDCLRIHGGALRREISGFATSITEAGASSTERLLVALEGEFSGQAQCFIQMLEDMLTENQGDYEYSQWLRRAVDCLRERLQPRLGVSFDGLWYEARDLIESATVRAQLQHRIQFDEDYVRLLEISEQAWRDLDLTSFKQCLTKILPSLGIRTASISLYTEGSSSELQPYIVLLDGNPLDPLPPGFAANALMPPELLRAAESHTLVVFSLVVESRQFGVVAFEDVLQLSGFQMLRDHVSTALGGILLHHEVIQKTAEHERSLQERQATNKRLDALSLLAGGVAHDLNNAIGPLVALPEVILRELEGVAAGQDPSNLRADLQTINSAALRAAQTIKDLLTLGRQGRIAKQPLDLCQTVHTCLSEESARLAKASNGRVQLVVEVSNGPLIIRGSHSHLTRALGNLLHNAIEAISGTGEVKVRIFNQRVQTPISGYESVEPGDYAVIVVSDSGHGIARDEISHIFEPFFSRKQLGDQSGSGLGLAIVYGVVKEHEGFLDVTSEIGVGTSFALYFPRAAESLRPRERSAAVQFGTGRVLVVDDEQIQLRTARRILAGLGYSVDTVESGTKALEMFAQGLKRRSSPCDLVILDMNLKEAADGLDCFERIRQLFPTQRAILVSGHAPNARVELALERGLLWLSKPYTSAALANAVESALAERTSQMLTISSRDGTAPTIGK
ncbi:MAG TPA: substrate-binding domain-containing protein, partial [Polyangiaceae bacterium]